MKIALVSNNDFSMWQFRKGLISALVKRGLTVYTITPDGPFVPKIKNLGAVHITIPISRFINPVNDLKACFYLYRIFHKEKFDLVHNMAMKPIIYGSITAKLAGIKKIVGLVAGFGFTFSDINSIRLKMLRPVIEKMLKMGFWCCSKVWFQNPDDLSYSVENKLISKQKTILIKGSGVDLEEFSLKNIDIKDIEKIKKEFTIEKEDKVVLMITARLIWSKGVKEFLESAEILTKKYSNAKFILIAPRASNSPIALKESNSPDSIPSEYINSFKSLNISVIIEFRYDIKQLIATSDIFVLPSYYREGVPRVLLEALALEKPIITTNNVGCREVVENGKNGYLVPIKDSESLIEAIEKLLINDSLRENFGRYSRIKAENEFDEKSINQRVIKEVYQFSQ